MDCAVVYIKVLNIVNYSTYYVANVCRFAMIVQGVCVSVCLSQIYSISTLQYETYRSVYTNSLEKVKMCACHIVMGWLRLVGSLKL